MARGCWLRLGHGPAGAQQQLACSLSGLAAGQHRAPPRSPPHPPPCTGGGQGAQGTGHRACAQGPLLPGNRRRPETERRASPCSSLRCHGHILRVTSRRRGIQNEWIRAGGLGGASGSRRRGGGQPVTEPVNESGPDRSLLARPRLGPPLWCPCPPTPVTLPPAQAPLKSDSRNLRKNSVHEHEPSQATCPPLSPGATLTTLSLLCPPRAQKSPGWQAWAWEAGAAGATGDNGAQHQRLGTPGLAGLSRPANAPSLLGCPCQPWRVRVLSAVVMDSPAARKRGTDRESVTVCGS